MQLICFYFIFFLTQGLFAPANNTIRSRIYQLYIICDLKTVENELHFVFDCPTYSQLRLVYYNWIIKIYPDFLSLSQTEKLKVMLTDKRVIQKSGLFIQNCFLTRTSKLFVQTDS